MNKFLVPIVLALSLSSIPLSSANSPEAADRQAQTLVAHTTPHWAYEGEGGPENWGKLDPKFEVCAKGTHQSPIDLKSGSKSRLEPIEFFYKPSRIHIENNGHTMQVNFDSGSFIRIGNHKYDLLQFHYHSPSEHLTNEKNYPLEIHFVHKSQKGELAVLGVFVKEGHANGAYRKFLEHLPKKAQEKFDGKKTEVVNADNLLPSTKTLFRYDGSLTTPPCSEGVLWNVFHEPIEMSAEQIDRLRSFYAKNARPVQDPHQREIKSN